MSSFKNPDLAASIVLRFSFRMISLLKNLGDDDENEVGDDCGELEVELVVELEGEEV